MEHQGEDQESGDNEGVFSEVMHQYCNQFQREQHLGAFFRGTPLRKRTSQGVADSVSTYKSARDSIPQKCEEEKPPPSPDTARPADDLKSLDASMSRQWEWDSYGDVGYENAERKSETDLSTLEKMALQKRRETDCEDVVHEIYTAGVPTAQSTPTEQASATFKTVKCKKSFKSHKKKARAKRRSDKNVENFNIDMTKRYSINIGAGDNNALIKNIPIPDESEHGDIERKNVTIKSESSKGDDKQIQTVSSKTIATSTQSSLEYRKPHRPEETSMPTTSSAPIIFNLVAPVSEKTTYISEKTTRKSFKNQTSKSQSTEDENSEMSPSAPFHCVSSKFSESLLSRADSFEYMPGHLYKNTLEKKEDVLVHLRAESHTSRSGESVESIVELINTLVNKKCSNPDQKRELGDKIVNLLMTPPLTSERSCRRSIDFAEMPVPVEKCKSKMMEETNQVYHKFKKPFRNCISEPIQADELIKQDETICTVSAPASLSHGLDAYVDRDSCKSTCGSLENKQIGFQQGSFEYDDANSSDNKLSENERKIDHTEIYKNLNSINRKISELNLLMKKHVESGDGHSSPKNKWGSLPARKNKFDSPKQKRGDGAAHVPPLDLKKFSDESKNDSSISENKSKSKATSLDKNSERSAISVTEGSVNEKDTLSSLSIKSIPPTSQHSYSSSLLSKISTQKSSKSSDMSMEVDRADKLSKKYKKCKIMKDFLKDYEDLILKYHRMKIHKAIVSSETITAESTDKKVVDVTREKLPVNKDCQTDFSKMESPPIDSSKRSRSKSSNETVSERQSPKSHRLQDFEVNLRKFLDDEYTRLTMDYKNSLNIVVSNKLTKETSLTSQDTLKNLTNSTIKTDKSEDKYEKVKSNEHRSESKSDKSTKSKISCDCGENVNVACKFCRKKLLISYLKKKVKEQKSKKEYPKPIAYNLVLLQSDSVCKDKNVPRKKTLEDVVMKVPRFQKRIDKGCKIDFQYVKKIPEIKLSSESEEKGSTDEQLKELSSLKTDSEIERSDRLRSIREYLEINRPKFLNNANQRWNTIKRQQENREYNNAVLREIVRLGLANLPCSKHISETDLRNIAKMYGIDFSKGEKVFNSKAAVQNTAKIYRTLPEVQNKKDNIKKQQKKKENLFISELFSKRLQQKTLKGDVNTPHTAKVLSL